MESLVLEFGLDPHLPPDPSHCWHLESIPAVQLTEKPPAMALLRTSTEAVGLANATAFSKVEGNVDQRIYTKHIAIAIAIEPIWRRWWYLQTRADGAAEIQSNIQVTRNIAESV
ncbi:hypothetical protein H5410_008856 [Solanum commersonii]|uniref:Uncharacterized protein n=1 Tax=Solanum commersonii TaxID=4109 RepID=A0A9J6AG53_SOLCO|nr:hypothetical protein H5410_008856 [Solanum commersonii]